MPNRIDFCKFPELTDFREQLGSAKGAHDRQGLAQDEDELTLVDKLIAALRHPVPDRAGLAIDILAYRLQEPRAILPLIDLLSEATDAFILKQAALALGHFRDERAVEPLRELRARATAPLVARLAAVVALAQIGGDNSQAALREALSDASESVRMRAALALGGQVPAPIEPVASARNH